MTLEEYRKANKLTQKQLAEELQEVCPGIDRVLISKIESGFCSPTEEVQIYLERKTSLKACTHADMERKNDCRYITHLSEKNAEIGDFSTEEQTVLDALKECSKENPLTRSALREILHYKDRAARRVIGDLRDKGVRVVGSGSTKGYYIAESESEYRAFRNEYHKKAMTYLNRISAMDRYTEGQVSM